MGALAYYFIVGNRRLSDDSPAFPAGQKSDKSIGDSVLCGEQKPEGVERSYCFLSADNGTCGDDWYGKYCRSSNSHGTGRTGGLVLDAVVRCDRFIYQTGGKYSVRPLSDRRS